MAGTTFGQTAAAAVLGKVEKARLYISGAAAQPNSGLDTVSATRQAMSAGVSALSGTANGAATCEMTVQYNPSSISFAANAEPVEYSSLQQGTDPNVPVQNVRPPNVAMTVQLFFDDVNPQEAFLMDKMNITPGAVISDIAALKKEVYSVQAQTNGLVALLLRPETQSVTFAWADLSFTGKVSEVQAKYIMFSPTGRPIRSTVRLVLSQSIESADGEGYWNRVLDEVFAQDSKLGGVSPAEVFSPLLNLDSF